MVLAIRILPRALRDLESIRTHIEHNDAKASERVAQAFHESFELLALNPGIGRQTEGRPTREWVVPGLPYLIPYRAKPDCIEILRVFHLRRRRPGRWV